MEKEVSNMKSLFRFLTATLMVLSFSTFGFTQGVTTGYGGQSGQVATQDQYGYGYNQQNGSTDQGYGSSQMGTTVNGQYGKSQMGTNDRSNGTYGQSQTGSSGKGAAQSQMSSNVVRPQPGNEEYGRYGGHQYGSQNMGSNDQSGPKYSYAPQAGRGYSEMGSQSQPGYASNEVTTSGMTTGSVSSQS